MPVMDVINLACNENDTKKDFSLAFSLNPSLVALVTSLDSLRSSDITVSIASHRIIRVICISHSNDVNPFVFCRCLAAYLGKRLQ